jgi:septum site-determining protein MinC
MSNNNAIEIRGNMYTLMSVVLHSVDLATVARALNARTQQAPEFFSNTPVIVDFSQVPVNASTNFKALFKVVRQRGLLPVAVRGLPEALSETLQGLGVPVVEQNSPQQTSAPAEQAAEPDLIVGKPGSPLIIERPLRAGQRCYARNADLIVTGNTLPDNELIADGNIHVYGTLRGRALCGMQGNTEARIFCRALDAVTVSVGSQSLQPVELSGELKTAAALQIRLIEDVVTILPLGGS